MSTWAASRGLSAAARPNCNSVATGVAAPRNIGVGFEHSSAAPCGASAHWPTSPGCQKARCCSRSASWTCRRDAPTLLAMPGCGPLSAAKIVAETAGVARFPTEAAFPGSPASHPPPRGREAPKGGCGTSSRATAKSTVTTVVRCDRSPHQLYLRAALLQVQGSREASSSWPPPTSTPAGCAPSPGLEPTLGGFKYLRPRSPKVSQLVRATTYQRRPFAASSTC